MTATGLASVCVVGNLNTDLIFRGITHLPDWGTEAVASSSISVPAGQAGNLAFGLRRLGVPTRVIGAVGGDPAGDRIIAALASAGVDAGGSRAYPKAARESPSPLYAPMGNVRSSRTSGAGTTSTRPWCIATGTAQTAARSFAWWACSISALSTLRPQPASSPRPGIRAVPPCSTRAGYLGGWPPETVSAFLRLLGEIDVFLPNKDEAAAISGSADPATAARILQDAGPSTVVVKCGADGSYGRHGDQTYQVPAIRVPVADAVGAGDMFDAAFIRARLSGDGLVASMDFANVAAGLYVSRPDDRFPTPQQVASASVLVREAASS